MTRTAGASVGRRLLLLVALAAVAVPIVVLQAGRPVDLDGPRLAWVTSLALGGVLLGGSAAALLAMIRALRDGPMSAFLVAGSAAALASGSLILLAGASSMALPVTTAALLLLAASVADRAEAFVPRDRERLAGGAGLLLVTEAAVVLQLLPTTGAAIRGVELPLLLSAAVMAAIGAMAARSSTRGAAAGLIAIGAAGLALDRGGGGDLSVAAAALIGACVFMARTAARERPPADDPADHRLPDVSPYLTEGVLRFDGRLQLRAWNPAAGALLGLGTDAGGTHLEDLLGITIAQLPAASETVAERTPVGGIELTIHREVDAVTVILHDPGVASDVDRLGRELRGTIEELIQARRTIELQRVEIERATTTDPVTGVANRAAILDRLRLEVSQARRYRHPVAAILLDVDRFTEINTAHGIAGGDGVLWEIALRTRVRIRESDALGRAGSDSFLAILPHTEADGAASFADALRRRIGDRPIQVGAASVTATVSAGVTVMHPFDDLDADGLLARLDEALASARGAGGDRIALDRLHGLARLGQAAASDEATTEDAAGG